ncbi:DUF389 domain-containing protein [Limnoraphis robusta]|uniref:DUF389 domain-containing protein n=1 Tax=Limnoraphis robusta CCNP1315 TaxID=3110306 RepID=A0ABU5TUQ4_9CYAN|nr:DUF389 domain-containing protein [Limnoraphis robusta]MEA5518630.1 DUF389 domain-containing protein [Limnoraphis robusta CCNP1315]MEA5548504.1 DUF389 domain-containing protein [Limnoraphis robusta CCNP1324]
MRQLWVKVPNGQGKKVLSIAEAHQGINLARFAVIDDQESQELVLIHVSNQQVESLLNQLDNIPNLEVTLIPHGIIALHPPASEAAEQIKEVQERSPIEIFLGGLQSVGSWRGFLGYAGLAGVVVWIGLFTNTNYLLVAAMLIAPFAGPAMNVAIATSRGDLKLLWRSLLRYFVAIIVTVLVAAILSLILRQEIPTSLMLSNSQISAVAVLLPITAGAAGAINLMQSERSSLVSGAATGMLVAASLAPPAGTAGMALSLGRMDIFIGSVFLVLLQLVGINLSAALLFRFYGGLSPKGARYNRGKQWVFPITLGVTTLALIGLLNWQFINSPAFERSSRAQRATADIQQVVKDNPLVKLVEANVRFTRSNIEAQDTLLCVLYVQRDTGVTISKDQISERLTREIQNYVNEAGYNVTPLVQVTVLDPPSLL